jgi:hypothetical protein
MKPMIDQAFWSDPDIEGAKAGVKLAALWLITNSQTSLLGICGASVSRFVFETGLNEKALDGALEALPRAFKRFGGVIFVRNYIRHQFGSGEKLIKNNFFVALKSLFLSVKDLDLRAFILCEYPEFEQALAKPSEGLTKPQSVKEGEVKTGSAEGGENAEPPGWGPPPERWIAECERNSIPAWYAEKKYEVFSAKDWAIGRTPAKWKKLVPLVHRDFVNDGSPQTEAAASPNGNGHKPKGDGMFLTQ